MGNKFIKVKICQNRNIILPTELFCDSNNRTVLWCPNHKVTRRLSSNVQLSLDLIMILVVFS